MVEANNDMAMSESAGDVSDSEMHEVVMKPQTNFSNNALRKVVPQVDLKDKKLSLSMSMINIRKAGGSRLFSQNLKNVEGNQKGPNISCNFIQKSISFSSPRGRDIEKKVR